MMIRQVQAGHRVGNPALAILTTLDPETLGEALVDTGDAVAGGLISFVKAVASSAAVGVKTASRSVSHGVSRATVKTVCHVTGLCPAGQGAVTGHDWKHQVVPSGDRSDPGYWQVRTCRKCGRQHLLAALSTAVCAAG